jgi:hypothetical protein
MARSLPVVIMLALTSAVWAFSINGISSSSSQVLTRREWSALIAGTVLATPLMANADITNKLASSSALRNVKRSLKQLDSLELYVTTDNYEELKRSLRLAPLADVRKNCFILVRGGEDGPDAQSLKLLYQKFILALEQMDSTAGLAMRGRKIPKGTFYASYKVTVSTLADFLKVAEEAADISVQYIE